MSYETLSALIGILGVIAGVVYGRLALRQAHAIAAAQGAYAAERLHLTLYGARLVDDYVVALPQVRSAPCVLPLNIGLLNAGERTSNDIELYVRMSEFTQFLPGELTTAAGTATGRRFEKTAQEGHYVVNGVSLGSLHPRKSLNLQLLIAIPPGSECLSDQSVPFTTADGHKVTATFKLLMHPFLDIIVLSRDRLPLRHRLNLIFADTDGSGAKEWFAENGKDLAGMHLQSLRQRGASKDSSTSVPFHFIVIDQSGETNYNTRLLIGTMTENGCEIPDLATAG